MSWWWRGGKRSADHDLHPAFERHPDRSPAPKWDPILELQRSVGNRAAQKLLPSSEGEALDADQRAHLETAFEQDLGEVRIHRDEEAAELAASAGANALTMGRHIYFARGAYSAAPLAHEVSHVIQQRGAGSQSIGEDAFLEHQAEAASAAVLSGHAVEMSTVAAAPGVQRQAVPGPSPASTTADYLTLDDFEIDKSALGGRQKQKLDEFAKHLKSTLASSPDLLVSVIGYTDAPGTEPHNFDLGLRRAESVRDYLLAKGIAENQLRAASRGEESLLVKSSGYEAKNRRVEIDVVQHKLAKDAPVAIAPAPVKAAPPKIDLTYHPEAHQPTPSEEFQLKLREIDKAVREAKADEAAHPGTSIADASGRALRSVARKLGLSQRVQDLAESLGKDLPSKGAQAIMGQIAADRGLDADAQNALKAAVDAMMRTKVK